MTPKVKASTEAWRFEIENKNYTQIVDAIALWETQCPIHSLHWTDVTSRYYKLKFDLACEEGALPEQNVFLKTDVAEGQQNEEQQSPGGEIPGRWRIRWHGRLSV